MNPYYSFNKKESVLLLISFVVLVLLTLAAGWIIGIMVRSESAQKNTETTGHAVPLPSQMGSIPGVAEVKQVSASVNSARKDAAALVPASNAGGSASPSAADVKTDAKEEEKAPNEDQKTQTVKTQTENIPSPDSGQSSDKSAGNTADTQEKDKAGSTDARFSVIADSFVVKTKALKRMNELKEKGYSKILILCFPSSDKDSNIMNYLIQIGNYETLAAANFAASEFQEKEKSIAVIRPVSLSDLKEKAMKTENREGEE